MAASDVFNRVAFFTATTGTGSIAVGAAISSVFFTPAQAGVANGKPVTMLILDGGDVELVKGVYSTSGPTVTRATVIASKIGGTVGTDKLDLTGNAVVRFVEAAEDHWTRDTASLVRLSGDQTIAGIKTFSSIPVGPASNPTTDDQLVRKKYVDDAVAPGTELIASVNPTSGSAVDFTDIPLTYRDLAIVIAAISAAGGSPSLYFRYSTQTGGSPTFETANHYANVYDGGYSSGAYLLNLSAAASAYSAAITLLGYGSAVGPKLLLSAGDQGYGYNIKTPAAIRAVRLYLNTNSFDAGTISLYGIK